MSPPTAIRVGPDGRWGLCRRYFETEFSYKNPHGSKRLSQRKLKLPSLQHVE